MSNSGGGDSLGESQGSELDSEMGSTKDTDSVVGDTDPFREEFGAILDADDEGNDEEKMKWDGVAPLPSYYLRNFFLVVDSVLAKNRHLFLAEELEIVDRFSEIDESAQR